MYSFWQTVTGTTAASKAKAASKKATAKKTTKKAVAKKTSAKASPSKPAAKTPRKSVQCFLFYWLTRTLTLYFVAHQAILKCSNSHDLCMISDSVPLSTWSEHPVSSRPFSFGFTIVSSDFCVAFYFFITVVLLLLNYWCILLYNVLRFPMCWPIV